nr:zinc finger BED domain-containing protein RICESLEEPER 2-like [Quercus suber]
MELDESSSDVVPAMGERFLQNPTILITILTLLYLMQVQMEETNSNNVENTNDVEIITEEEVDDLEDVIVLMEGQKKKRRRKTSLVWPHFEMVSPGPDKKPRCKCKRCGLVYLVSGNYGTGNLKRHLENCVRRDTRDVGQLLLSKNGGAVSKFEPDKFRELLVAAIVMHDLPFCFVEYTAIRAIFAYLCPEATIITRNTARADLIKMHGREKEKIKFMLKDAPSRISLTSDLWTSVITDGYMCITAHFIDRNWWEIKNKVFYVTLDNASSNDVSVDILRTQLSIRKALVCNGDFFHLHCCAHILNLIIQDGLKEIDIAIQKIRESVKYVKGSQVRKQKLLESVNVFRWRAFCHLELTNSNYKNCPTIDEWSRVEKIDKFLTVFYDATCAFFGTKYPAANLYFPSVFMIYLTLRQQMENEDEYMRRMAIQMLAKFEKYWLDFNVPLAIAVTLDPRYKLQFVNFCYKKLYGYSGSPAYLNVCEKLFSLSLEYASNAPTTSASIGKRGGKVVHFRFPELASMARDVLSVPISTHASESTFSVGGRVIDQFRSSLRLDTVEALVCTRDWLYGEKEVQVPIDDVSTFMQQEEPIIESTQEEKFQQVSEDLEGALDVEVDSDESGTEPFMIHEVDEHLQVVEVQKVDTMVQDKIVPIQHIDFVFLEEFYGVMELKRLFTEIA